MERHGIRWPHRDAIDTLFDPQTGVSLILPPRTSVKR